MKKTFKLFILLGLILFINSAVWAKYVTLSGYLNLSGTIFVPSQNSYVSGYVNGWVTLRDTTGGYYTNNIYVNSYVGFFVNSNYIYTTTYPNAYFTVYNKDGKAVGSGYINHGIGVSGLISGNYVHLTGSSYITVSVNVNDD